MSADSPSLELGNLQPLAPNPNGILPVPVVNSSSTHPNVFTDAQLEDYKEQDRWLPIANVARIMKNSLPAPAKVSKEAKECVQECVSEFISFITSEAADKCLTEKRKTINGEDILGSMRSLGFDNYESSLKIYLAKYRAVRLGYLTRIKLTSQHQNVVTAQKAQAQNGGGGTGASTPSGPSDHFLHDLNAQHKRDFQFSPGNDEDDEVDGEEDGQGNKRRKGE